MSPITSAHSSASDRQPTRRAIVRGLAGAASAAFLAAGWTVQSAARPTFETGSAPVLPSPVKIVAIYGHPENIEHFEGYYRTVHVPLSLKMPYCASIETAVAVSDMAEEKATFYRIATLTFNSEADMVACMESEAGQAVLADVANFASGGVTATVVSDVQARQLVSQAGPSTEFTVPQRYEQRRMD